MPVARSGAKPRRAPKPRPVTAARRPRSTEAERSLRLSRVFAAPPEQVFSAWTDPKQLAQWWGPKGMRAGVVELDVRPGGRWRTSMIGEDGREFFVSGVYRKIARPRLLVFTWGWEEDGERGHETVITLEFKRHLRGTELILTQSVFETKLARNRHNAGWNSSFDCLEEYLARS